MTPLECVNGEAMVLAGAAIAIQIAQTSTVAAFFTILGDNLAMVATQRANLSSQQCQRQDSVNSSDSRCTEEEKRVEWDNNITTESGNSS